MRATIAGTISQTIRDMGVPVQNVLWKSEIEMPYFVGELADDGGSSEVRKFEGRYTLDGWDVGGMGTLLETKDTIAERFDSETIDLEDGSVVVVDYLGCTPISTGEPDLFRLQINLQVTEWRNY